ncbi:hypothetical protein JQS35_10905 [Alcaligenes faecalis subsp. faecalis]|uniref:hypothetical protein n=1 Tax=Alcaligenes faecalis TaxID=511 RepID=UPI001F2E9EF8|nr:hypothetical protein [Alcaligenes faecalis]MBW4789107.1 hypothetical protein [Alcaligenes faecalis subsp. faecalis]
MQTRDAATTFTLDYLELLEKHLNVTWNADGDPVCIIDWINEESLTNLREALRKLFQSDLECSARQASIKFGENHIQAVGFGLAPDFHQFIKLGLIYGERVVLWDVIHSRIFVNDQPNWDQKSLLAQIACNLLVLKPVVERGSVVILSHPIVWSALAFEIDTELRATGPVPAASLGLSLAFAAIEGGIPLHPYTLLEGGSKPKSATAIGGLEDELFSSENYQFQQCVTSLLRDFRMAYLEDIRIETFLDVLSTHNQLRRSLRKHFSPSLNGLSTQQATAETRSLVDDLFLLINNQNKAVVDYAAEGVEATAQFALVSASTTILGMPLINALGALGAPAVYLSTAVRKWAKKPEKNVIIQAFSALENAAAMSQTRSLVDMEYQISHYHRGQSSLGELYVKFIELRWTEQRHDLLKTLSPEVAKELLALLSPEDLELIVNWRKFQEAYIGEYLEYLSELDEAIYWEHLGKTFESTEGLVIYDDEFHLEFMKAQGMPLRAWQQLLGSLFKAYANEMRSKSYNYPLEQFPSIVRFQTESTSNADEKRLALISLASNLEKDDKMALMHFIEKTFEGTIPEWFKVGTI